MIVQIVIKMNFIQTCSIYRYINGIYIQLSHQILHICQYVNVSAKHYVTSPAHYPDLIRNGRDNDFTDTRNDNDTTNKS